MVVFQSLFSWNLPSDKTSVLPRELVHVSILVFVELALGHSGTTVAELRPLCFNPCFRGTCPRTENVQLKIDISKLRFQSLFSWNLPSDLYY